MSYDHVHVGPGDFMQLVYKLYYWVLDCEKAMMDSLITQCSLDNHFVCLSRRLCLSLNFRKRAQKTYCLATVCQGTRATIFGAV